MLELTSPEQAAVWLKSHVTGSLQTDSRQVRSGDGFIAWPGSATDARAFVETAVQNGAHACLVEQQGADKYSFTSGEVASYLGLKAASGLIAAAFFDDASKKLDVVAVTGTNGKTSTSWWLAHALSNLRCHEPIECGLVGTLGVGIFSPVETGVSRSIRLTSTGMTTPDPVLLQKTFRDFVNQGLTACALEASSIGIEENRLNGTRIRVAVFTNFTQDHLDYHGSMQSYWHAKASLFNWTGLQAAVVNVDDPKGEEIATSLSQRIGQNVLDTWTVSSRVQARLQATEIECSELGMSFWIVEGTGRLRMTTKTIGRYNVDNLLCVIGSMRSLGVPLSACVAACQSLAPVPGRMECQGGVQQPLVVIDYAHTPDALDQALTALRPVAQYRGGQLWCVFGCGGDRDSSKRAMMGRIASVNADRVIVTNDNPRKENPQRIIDQVLSDTPLGELVSTQLDRSLAIRQAVSQAQAHDVILLAGKGDEDYQEIDGVKLPFSDRLHVNHALLDRTGSTAKPQKEALT